MRQALRYPFDLGTLMRRRRALKAELERGGPFIELRVALLGGSTTSEIRQFLELFLMDAGIKPIFYESEYNRFYEDAVVDDAAITAFSPQIVCIHTTHHNIQRWPGLLDKRSAVDAAFDDELSRFVRLWDRLLEVDGRLIIQNNFDAPPVDALGHLEASAPFGRRRFIARLNEAFAMFADAEPRLRINDIAHLSAQCGLNAWSSPQHWLAYKMAVTPAAAVAVAHQLTRIIRAALGRTKKCLVLDLDNTLWGGVVGEEGVDRLRVGRETPEAEAFTAFQTYCRTLRERGVLLAACSKNEDATAREGFTHPDMVLKLEDFSAFVASFRPKPEGLRTIAETLGIGLDSLVFVDDDPVERARVARELPEVSVVDVDDVSRFAETIDREGLFEPFALTQDDRPRAERYAHNAQRAALAASLGDEDAFLASLEMVAEVGRFAEPYLERIAQLTNKTNQFNLTTRRYTLAEITQVASDERYLTLYGRLRDRFGDNGVVSVMIGRVQSSELHIELWLMSCRVLKRTMEHTMFAALLDAARGLGIEKLVGHYRRTPKNGMVADLYPSLGFAVSDRGQDAASFELMLRDAREPTPQHIRRSTT